MQTNGVRKIRRHIHIMYCLVVALLVNVAWFYISFATQTSPYCQGEPATIWVDEAHIVQPINRPYTGVLKGTDHDDVIIGTNGDDIIYGRGGNDKICSLKGNDVIK